MINDLSAAIKTAVEDSEVTYALGFYPVDIKLDGSYHSLSVKVARNRRESSLSQRLLRDRPETADRTPA